MLGQQRSSSVVYDSAYSTDPSVCPVQGLPVTGNTYDAAAAVGVSSVGGNVAMVLPGRQPLFAVSAVASDMPTLMSQLVLAGASIQNSLMASAVYNGHGFLPSDQYSSSLSVPNTAAGPGSSPAHGAFTSP